MKINFIVVTTIVYVMFASGVVCGATLHVPSDYLTIQTAIDAASLRDTIAIADGTYEENIVLRNGIEVVGSGVDNTILTAVDGTIVTATGVSTETVIKDVTIDGQWTAEWGIECLDANLSITHTKVTRVWGGIRCDGGSAKITGNIITNTVSYGMYLNSASPVIEGNTLTQCGAVGIHAVNSAFSVRNNNIDNATSGFILDGVSTPIVTENRVSECHTGISVYAQSRPQLYQNQIHDNTRGMHITSSGFPILGTDLEPGQNMLHANHLHHIHDERTYTVAPIQAKGNWWGQSPPNEEMFVGNIDYIPWLESASVMPPEGFPEGFPRWDVNSDGVVDIGDLVLVGLHYGEDYRVIQAMAAQSQLQEWSEHVARVLLEVRETSSSLPPEYLLVDIAASDAPELYGYELNLAYDPHSLNPVGIIPGSMLATSDVSTYWEGGQIDSEGGRIHSIRQLRKGTKEGVDKEGVLATIVFEVTSPLLRPRTWLRVLELTLVDAHTRHIPVEAEEFVLAWEEGLVPERPTLLPNYPNPCNPDTWIPYELTAQVDVTVTIHDSQGHLIRTLNAGQRAAGLYHSRARATHWDGRNQEGEHVTSGLYYYTIRAGDFRATRKMMVVR